MPDDLDRRNNSIHMIVSPSREMSPGPPVLTSCKAFKVLGSLVITADASSSAMSIDDMIAATFHELVPDKPRVKVEAS